SLFKTIILLCFTSNIYAQTFADFIQRVNTVPANQKTAIVDSFMANASGFPFIEGDTLTHFIFRGSASSVAIPGDANNWSPSAFQWPGYRARICGIVHRSSSLMRD
ncbi:MAG: hypothetical protein ACE5I1_02480, partial [bacterium]